MILPNVRASFGRAEAGYVIWLLTRGQEAARCGEEERVREEGFDTVLDDPRTFNALLAGGGFSTAPQPLVFYLLARHALLESGMSDRQLADYVAALLIEFGGNRRAWRIDDEDASEYGYLADLASAAETSSGHRAFLLKAHLGEYALWLSGLFPDFITARVQRRGAPGIRYYEELGASGYRGAADHYVAERNGLDRVYRSCAESFVPLRVALNRIADRHLFPARGDAIERLLRQMNDNLRSTAN